MAAKHSAGAPRLSPRTRGAGKWLRIITTATGERIFLTRTSEKATFWTTFMLCTRADGQMPVPPWTPSWRRWSSAPTT